VSGTAAGPSLAGEPAGDERPQAGAGGAGQARSLWLALGLLAAGAATVLAGAGRAWATVRATSEVPQLGVNWSSTATVSGNDVSPFSAFALLAVLLTLGIAVTRGRGRWPVGAALLLLGLAIATLAADRGTDTGGLRDLAFMLATTGRIEGLPAGAELHVDASPVSPLLVVAGGTLIALAGIVTVFRGRHWPAMGDRYRAPGDARPGDEADPDG
jgi:Tryptophan-associated transmembrane protein (Trp_oprn_chp)